ncbi:MAG: ferredoxin [Gemmatimonadetes bacterium]|nr:ferredoxin [Gemmatimonadota bacterium]
MSQSVATELRPIAIDRTRCDLCGACAGMCAPDSIRIDHAMIEVDQHSCTLCMKCVPTCPVTAISGGKA